jgi:tetratricopeptide (TPR) repeat protein
MRRYLAAACLALMCSGMLAAETDCSELIGQAESCCEAEVSPATVVIPTDLAALLDRGVAAEADNDFAAAGDCYRSATERFANASLAWSVYGEYLRFFAHDAPAARVAFERALATTDHDERARGLALKGLGDLAYTDGDQASAQEYFRQSLAAYPLVSTHRAVVHMLLSEQRDFEVAAAHIEQALALQPDEPITLLLAANVRERLGQHEAGRSAYEKALGVAGCDKNARSDDPVHCCVFYNAACYLAISGDRPGALTFLRAFLDTPNHVHRTRDEIRADPDFATLLDDSEFTTLIEESDLPR